MLGSESHRGGEECRAFSQAASAPLRGGSARSRSLSAVSLAQPLSGAGASQSTAALSPASGAGTGARVAGGVADAGEFDGGCRSAGYDVGIEREAPRLYLLRRMEP